MIAERANFEDREGPLDEIIASYLEAVENGLAPDRRQWLARYPELAEELAAFFADEDEFDGLVAPLRAGTPLPPAGQTQSHGPTVRLQDAEAEPVTSRRFGDYELLEEAARGGMGVVYKARQVSLNRLVAVKMIRDAEWAVSGEVQRFRLEAEAVANLDHPHIVPIYEVGAHNNQQYFSMKWVEGGNLAQAIARGEWSQAGAANQRAAAQLLATVARAIHYAHQRGILHRDLKPANILLARSTGGDALPMIADFGLAKRVTTDDGLTQSGTAVGTPSYMAPEQAVPGPKGSALTMVADVYSLGAILYELLTGQPPFRAATALETLRDLLEREPQRPRALNPAVDRDLETVCLKCLEKDPAKRYGSAAALADDLERFLNGEPVQARPVGSLERLRRWCRRNRVLAGVSALAVAALVAATAVSLLLAVRESAHAARRDEAAKELRKALADAQAKEALAETRRRTAEVHEKEADRQRLLEEGSFRQAHKAVNEFCVRVSEELRHTPGLQPLRKRLFEEALGYYQRFLKQRARDPKLKRELAEAQFNLAMMASEIGRKVDAAVAYRAALAIYRELQQADPADVGLRFREANALCNLGVVQQALGHPKESLATYLRARECYEGLLQGQPNHPLARSGLAEVYSGLGSLQRRAGQFTQAVESYRKAVATREQLTHDQPKDGRQRDALALAYNNLGVAQTHAGMAGPALESYQKALAIREGRARQEPKSPGLQMAVTGSLRDLALIHRDRGEIGEALGFLQRALDLRARVVEENPSVVPYQAELAACHVDIGQFHHAAGRLKDALDGYEKGRRILEKLVRVDGSAPNLRSDLAVVHFHIGTLSMGNRQYDQAARAFTIARKLQEKLVKDHPDLLDYRGRLAGTLNNLAVVRGRQGRIDEARLLVQEGIVCQRVAITNAPQIVAYRRTLSNLYHNLADTETVAKRPAEAMAAVVAHRKLWPTDAKEQFRAALDLARAAKLIGTGKTQFSAAEEAERGKCAELVMGALRDAVAAGFRDRQRLEGNPALEFVRQRADFRKLLAELRAAGGKQ